MSFFPFLSGWGHDHGYGHGHGPGDGGIVNNLVVSMNDREPYRHRYYDDGPYWCGRRGSRGRGSSRGSGSRSSSSSSGSRR
jgi:hypothetical protein